MYFDVSCSCQNNAGYVNTTPYNGGDWTSNIYSSTSAYAFCYWQGGQGVCADQNKRVGTSIRCVVK